MAEEGTAKVLITNVHPSADGEWDLDLTRFTGDEAHLIKQIANVRLNELQEAIEAGDYDLILAFALIALARAGRKVPVTVLRAAELGSIVIDAGSDASPPDQTPSESTEPSGASGHTTGANQGNGQSPTGSRGSDTGSDSVPATSEA